MACKCSLVSLCVIASMRRHGSVVCFIRIISCAWKKMIPLVYLRLFSLLYSCFGVLVKTKEGQHYDLVVDKSSKDK